MTCTPLMIDAASGSITWIGTSQSTGVASTGLVRISWSVPTALTGYGALACTVPGKSGTASSAVMGMIATP